MKKDNKKIIKPIILIMLVSFLLVPTVALASWWNPFSWFKKSIKPVKQITVQVSQNNASVGIKQKPVEVKISDKQIPTPKVGDTQKKSTKGVSTPVVSPVVATPPTPQAFDVCKNIEGIQTFTPTGMYATNGNCVPVSTTTQPQSTTDVGSSQRQNYDQELSPLIVEARQRISTFEGAIKETEKFAPTVRATMDKYPNEFTIQQSGQELLNENSNLALISKKLVTVETERANKLSSYLGLSVLPQVEDFAQITQQYNNYYQQYQASNDRITSLISSFVLNEKAVLERLTQEAQQRLDNLQNSQSSSPTQISDPQIESALSALQTTLSNIENATVPMSVIEGRKKRAVQDWEKQNPNVFSSSVYVNRLNAILSSYGL